MDKVAILWVLELRIKSNLVTERKACHTENQFTLCKIENTSDYVPWDERYYRKHWVSLNIIQT